MRLSRVLTLAVAAFALGTATVPADALAKKGKDKSSEQAGEPLQIEETQISSFDETFGKVKDLQTKLQEMNTNIVTANDKITTALGLPQGTPVADALNDLKSKAGDKLTVALDGDKPKLSLADDAPENLKTAVTATNEAVNLWVDTLGKATTLHQDIMAVKDSAMALPGETPAAFKESGLPPTQLPKVTKTVQNNVKATTQTVEMANEVVKSLTTTLDTLKGFAG